jgi:hypothetical protein
MGAGLEYVITDEEEIKMIIHQLKNQRHLHES